MFGGDKSEQLRNRSEELVRAMEENPASIADFLRFENSGEKRKARTALEAKKADPGIQGKIELKKIEISGNKGTSTFVTVPNKVPQANQSLRGLMEWTIVFGWVYEDGEWYLETMKLGPLPEMNAREILLVSN